MKIWARRPSALISATWAPDQFAFVFACAFVFAIQFAFVFAFACAFVFAFAFAFCIP